MGLEYEGLGNTVEILLLLLERKEMKRSDFKIKFNYNTAKNILERLESVKLTKHKALGDRRDTVIWSLTEKGIEVAKRARDLENYISNTKE